MVLYFPFLNIPQRSKLLKPVPDCFGMLRFVEW